MLSKTTIIHLGQIQLPSMQDFEELVGVLDYCVTYNIRLHLVNQAYQDLDVAYQCNRHIIMDSSLETFIDYSRLIDMQALRTINHAIGKEIEGVLDSFYNYQTHFFGTDRYSVLAGHSPANHCCFKRAVLRWSFCRRQ